MKKENLELRSYISLRALGDARNISGTAIVFNVESELLDGIFTEIIAPMAVTPELLASSDIVMLVNHEDEEIPLARSKYGSGTLNITLTQTGVDFNFDVRDTAEGNEILSAVKAGDLDSCSFAFVVAEDGDSWVMKPDGTYLRTITKIEAIYDFSIVTRPAYTQASCRSLDKFKRENEVAIPDPAVPDPPAIVDPEPETVITDDPTIEGYYQELDNTIAEFESN